MGCFSACFGGDKDRKRHKERNEIVSKDPISKIVCQVPPRSTISLPEENIIEAPSSNLISELLDRPEEQLNLSARKRVTFDSKVTAYEPGPVYESTNSLPETKKADENETEEFLAKSSQSYLSSEESSAISIVGSYHPNHRYQNCRDSDDEIDGIDNSDLDDEDDIDDDVEDYGQCDKDQEGEIVLSLESRTNKSFQVNEEEVDSPLLISGLPEQEAKMAEAKGYVRDRSAYIHPVLNPVENLIQWETVKSKAAAPLTPQKENFIAEAPRTSFSLEPTFKQPFPSFKQEPTLTKDQEVMVDASLSNWLVSPETTPRKKASFPGFETVISEKGMSHGSNTVRSFEDRPILGALTVEELKKFSESSSPRKSPSRSPDDMPIIGTVGTYWNHSSSAKDSGSVSSFKGIPNSTSKYREDKTVNWHSTPFETRLEKALKRGAAEA